MQRGLRLDTDRPGPKSTFPLSSPPQGRLVPLSLNTYFCKVT